MGKQQHSINVISNRVTIGQYPALDKQRKHAIDKTIKYGLRANNTLRVNYRTKVLRRTRSKDVRPFELDFWELKWIDLLTIKNLIESNDLLKVMEYVYKINEKQFDSLDMLNCFGCFKWIKEQLEQISKIEQQELEHSFSPKEIAAGIEELNKFGYYPGLNGLTGGDITKEEEILQMPYTKIFRKFCLNKTNHDIEANLMNTK